MQLNSHSILYFILFIIFFVLILTILICLFPATIKNSLLSIIFKDLIHLFPLIFNLYFSDKLFKLKKYKFSNSEALDYILMFLPKYI